MMFIVIHGWNWMKVVYLTLNQAVIGRYSSHPESLLCVIYI